MCYSSVDMHASIWENFSGIINTYHPADSSCVIDRNFSSLSLIPSLSLPIILQNILLTLSQLPCWYDSRPQQPQATGAVTQCSFET